MCVEVESKSDDSRDLTESKKSISVTQIQQSSSSAFARNKVAESETVNHNGGIALTGDLGGHADVAGSSAVLPLRSVSNSGALYSRVRSQDRSSDESVEGDGDLLHSLLRAAGTTTGGGSADSSGLALRRRRRSNATELDVVSRERTASPVCVGVAEDLGPRTAGRRRSLPTPRLNVRDLAIPRPLSGAEVSVESNECSKMKPVGSTAVDLTIAALAGVGGGELLSDIDENITASSTSTVPNSSLKTNDSTMDSSMKYLTDKCPVDEIRLNNLNHKIVDKTTERQKTVEETFSSTRATESKDVHVVQHDVPNSSTDSIFHQTRSTESWSTRWLPRRSQSLRLYRLRDRSAVRGEVESQQIEANVQEFQTRAAPEREALRNRLRKLSQIYAATTDVDDTSRTWPASRRPCADGEESHATPTSVSAFPLRCGVDVVGASSSSTSTLQLKYDTDSLSSQKDEGFETASISSDVYLSSSQRSSMCDCDVALTTLSTVERRMDPVTTKTIDGTTEFQLEMLPPPPASLLNEPEVDETDMPPSSGEDPFTCSSDVFVLPPSELESAGCDVQRSSSNTSLGIASTTLVGEKRLSDVNTEFSRDGSPASVNNAASVSKKTGQTVGARQTGTVQMTPRRGSSLVASSTSRNVASTRATAATTSNHTAGGALPANKQSIRTPSAAVATTSTSGRLPAFQRSTPLRATDDRKSTLCSRGPQPPPSSSAFVRQSRTRATIAAPVLRTNKRAAAEARKMKAATQAPTGITPGGETNTECSCNQLSGSTKNVKQTAQTRAVAKSVPVPPCRSSSSRPTIPTPSTYSGVTPHQHRVRNRTSSSGSFSSTTSASAGPQLVSFRSINSGTTTRQPASSVPCTSSKKADGGGAASSSSLKMPSNLRHSTQPPSSRLRTPATTKKH